MDTPEERARLNGGFSKADLSRARRDTPGCEEVLHFNNAGASLMPQPVVDATVSHLRLEARIGGYEAAQRSTDDIERVYDATAALIGCGRDEVAVIENATRAWDMAFYSIPLGPVDSQHLLEDPDVVIRGDRVLHVETSP
jgi:cysteine desulfurase/selenocysteine lyase